jgi:mannose-6-phosphate isomerase
MRKVNKPWGFEEIIIENEKYVMKMLHINKGQRLSRQYHNKKDETVYVLKNVLLIDLSEDDTKQNTITFNEGETMRIKPRTIHRFVAPENKFVEVYEVSTPELDDVVRLSDDYGRIQ